VATLCVSSLNPRFGSWGEKVETDDLKLTKYLPNHDSLFNPGSRPFLVSAHLFTLFRLENCKLDRFPPHWESRFRSASFLASRTLPASFSPQFRLPQSPSIFSDGLCLSENLTANNYVKILCDALPWNLVAAIFRGYCNCGLNPGRSAYVLSTVAWKAYPQGRLVTTFVLFMFTGLRHSCWRQRNSDLRRTETKNSHC